MTLEADLDAMVKAAAGFGGVRDEIERVRTLAIGADGRGVDFGSLASLAGVTDAHDKFVTSILDALHQGSSTQDDIAAILVQIAKEYGRTDTQVADEFHNPDGTPRS